LINLKCQILESKGYQPVKTDRPTFIRFDTIPACDGQTELLKLRQRSAYYSRGTLLIDSPLGVPLFGDKGSKVDSRSL